MKQYLPLLDNDHFKDECGVFGIYNHPEAANLTFLGLHALQHRGQESAGIIATDGLEFNSCKEMGLVQEIFTPAVLKSLIGKVAIGHVRYSTAGGSNKQNIQPLHINYANGSLALCHNGNLINSSVLKQGLENSGSVFSSTSDTEVILHLIAKSKESNLSGRITEALSKITGAYSLLIMSENQLIAARDPKGFRPLCLGKLDNSYIVASESVAFDLIGAKFIRDIDPGELLIIDQSGLNSQRFSVKEFSTHCIFEYIYFSRPDSKVDGKNVYEVRKVLGQTLAIESPAEADIVIPVPDSGVPAAIGYAKQLNLPFEMGLIRSHYVGRTFILPDQNGRQSGVKLKLNAVESVLKNKRVIVIDDSLVRGTTSKQIIKMIREAGAKEVHLRLSSPPTKWSCFYGINTPNRQELIAANYSVEQIRDYIEADSIGYLSLNGLINSVNTIGKNINSFCSACFTGDYPLNENY